MEGGISKTVLQPTSPFFCIRTMALAQATSTLAVNSGLESRLREYSMVCLCSPLRPLTPLLMTQPPWGKAEWFFAISSAENTEEEVDYIISAVTEVVAYLRSISPVWRELESGKQKFILN